MNTLSLAQQLATLFEQLHGLTQRYRHTILSSKDPVRVDELCTTLQVLFPDYTVWHGFQIDESIMPIVGCSRAQFIQKAFNLPSAGLIIFDPDEWFRFWSKEDKRAFWSALSTRHGGGNVIVVLEETIDFIQLNQTYFTSKSLPDVEANFWTSVRTSLYS